MIDLQNLLKGIASYRYRTLNIDLTNGLAAKEISFPGAYIVYYNGIPDIQIQLNDLSQDFITLHQKGEIIAPFNKFYITSAPQAGQIITLFTSSDPDVKLTGQEVVVSSVAEIQNIDSVEKVTVLTPAIVNVTAAATLINASNAGRKNIIIKNTDAANTIYIGNNNLVTSGTGFPLGPLDVLSMNHYTGNIYGICAAGLAANAAVLSEG
ncbi:MAG: hypothetical protein M0Z48_04465 [Nitrospiraceae bacterium]|nr:hypothetical protein [Nitrospiraceae bacterium]